MRKTNEISAFDAKTHLYELLRETEGGKSFIIRRRGKAVARLVPPADEEKPDPATIIQELQEIRGRVSGRVKIKAMIEEGRRR